MFEPQKIIKYVLGFYCFKCDKTFSVETYEPDCTFMSSFTEDDGSRLSPDSVMEARSRLYARQHWQEHFTQSAQDMITKLKDGLNDEEETKMGAKL